MIVIGGLRVVVTGVLVMTDVEVEMENTGADLPVAVPVQSCVESKPGHTNRGNQEQS